MDYLLVLSWILLSWATIHFILFLVFVSTNKKLPPGPIPFPIVGSLFLIGESPHKSLAELAKVHGPLMYLRLGYQKAIVISSASMAKEVLHNNDASASYRAVPESMTALRHHDFSFVYLPTNDLWKSFRKICNNHVLSRTRLDAGKLLRRNKLEDLISYVKLSSQAGEAVDIGLVTLGTSLNLLSNTFFSIDLAAVDSRTCREFKEVFLQIALEASKPNLADYFPVLKRVDPHGIRRRMEVHFRKVFDFFNSIMNQRLAAMKGCLIENDVLDALLNICHDKSEELQLSHIPHLLMELFMGGTDTSSTTIEWAMTELLCNPEKMNKARQELELVVGKGIAVKEEDIPRLPYLEAIIKETLRMHGSVPLIPRKASSDIEIHGFTIPKNTQIIINLWAMGRDPSVWENPSSFEPERFLGGEIIDVKGHDFELIPFGTGRRICPGMSLAMRTIPLMLGSLINCFGWKLEDGVDPENMDMDDRFGLALHKSQPLRAIPINVV